MGHTAPADFRAPFFFFLLGVHQNERCGWDQAIRNLDVDAFLFYLQRRPLPGVDPTGLRRRQYSAAWLASPIEATW